MPRVKKNREKYSLYLDPEQMIWLRAEEERTGVPVSESIRRAIDAYRATKPD